MALTLTACAEHPGGLGAIHAVRLCGADRDANRTGECRRVVRAPYATLDKSEIHITTLSRARNLTRHISI